MTTGAMGPLLAEINFEVDKWKAKGLTPSTLKVGPDIEKKLRAIFSGNLPSTLMDMLVLTWPDNGFFVTGPWNYVPVKEQVKQIK